MFCDTSLAAPGATLGVWGEAPAEPLREGVRCIESLAARHEPSAMERLKLLSALDDACQAPSRACAASFSAMAPGEARDEVLRDVPDFWQTLLEAYDLLLARFSSGAEVASAGVIAALGVRALRAALQCARWAAYGGSVLDAACWQRANRVLLSAQKRQAESQAVRVRADRDSETTVEREYLALVAQHSLLIQQLEPASVDLALRLARQTLSQLEFSRIRGVSSQLWIDPAAAQPPGRVLAAGVPGTGACYFSAAAAVPSLQRMLDLAVRGRVPPELVPPGGAVLLASVLGYMIRLWSADVPVRHEKRHVISGPVEVVWGFSAVAEALHAGLIGGEFRPVAGCVLRDASSAGLGIELDRAAEWGTEVGTVLCVRTSDTTPPRVCVVRRWKREAGGRLQLGCEFLGEELGLLTVVAGHRALHALALDPLRSGIPARLVLPADMANQSVLRLIDQPGLAVLQALTPAEPGGDHVLRSYLPG